MPPSASAVLGARLSRGASGAAHSTLSFEEWLSHLTSARFVTSLPGSPIESVQWKEVPETTDGIGPTVASPRHPGQQSSPNAHWLSSDPLNTMPTSKPLPPHLAFLSKLVARDSNLGRVHLFTLNYDTLFEQALEALSVQYFDGFSGPSRRTLRPFSLRTRHLLPRGRLGGTCATLRQVPSFLQSYTAPSTGTFRTTLSEPVTRT